MDTQDAESQRRLDQFVDAAFAFAVTLLLITGSGAPESFADLRAALPNLPASAAAFVLIALLWSSHRSFGRLAARRDTASTLISLAIVFTVLVYVFPLRFIIQSMFGWFSWGLLPGRDLIDNFDDLQALYQVYGIGFAVISGLYTALFARCMLLAVSEQDRRDALAWRDCWGICAVSGIISALLAFMPLKFAPWLPPMTYSFIPVAIWIRGRLAAPRPQPEPAA